MNEKKTNILLVEDEEAHAHLICRSFDSASEPVSVTVARNLHEARSGISNSTPDLIIADFLLPDGKGIELIPADKEESPYPVIILTSHVDVKIAVEAMKAGAFDYIVKSEVTLDNMPRICERIMREWNHIARLKKAEADLYMIIEGTSAAVGEDFFYELVKHLQAVTKAHVVFCAELVDHVNLRARTLTIWIGDDFADNFEWNLIGTPCEHVIKGETMFFADNVQAKFPDDQWLAKVGVESYLAIPFINASGNVIGHMGILDNKPKLAQQHIEGILKLFAARAGGELERKQTDTKLKFTQFAVDNNADATYWVKLDAKISYANKAACRSLGYSYEELICMKISDIDPAFPDESWPAYGKETREAGMLTFESHHKTKAGLVFPVEIQTTHLEYKGEEYICAFVRNITERKKMEAVLLQTEKLKALGVITSGVAHDFNNILAIISGNIQLLQESFSDDKESADRLSIIRKAAGDGAEIVRRMRKFMVLEKDVSGFIPVNIKDVIEQSVDFTMPRWKNMARAGGIKYDIDMKGVNEVLTISGNPSELREVLINIINNALDAMPEGGTILFCTWSNDKNVYVSISDTGAGMTEEVKKKIFDPFFTTKRAKGSGLGMSVSYGIIKSQGGNIEVESEDGSGSMFTLTFPIDRETRQSKVSPEQTHEIKLDKLRILVIDDEEEICSILERFFTKDGHKVKSFMSCAEALKILKSEEFDLVLCDLVMPDLTGHDVIEFLDKLDKKPKIGLITGWDEKIESKEKGELKVDFITKKPFNLSELTKQINELFI
ncbi:MAG: response regulator [Candidatus Scalindua sp.]